MNKNDTAKSGLLFVSSVIATVTIIITCLCCSCCLLAQVTSNPRFNKYPLPIDKNF